MSGTALRAHLSLLADLGKIIGAMRNLAYAEVQRLNHRVDAQKRAEQVVLQALADGGFNQASSPGPCWWLVIGAERGFCGGFNDSLAEALPALSQRYPSAFWFVAGERLRSHLPRLPTPFEALPGCSNGEEASECVENWLDMLWPRLAAAAPGAELWVLYHAEQGICECRLLPLPTLPPPSPGPAPLRTLADTLLLPRLQIEWLRVGLLGALYQSLLQENHWRLAQMQRAQDHLDETRAHLKRTYFRQRQADITSELETLMSSLDAGLGLRGGTPKPMF